MCGIYGLVQYTKCKETKRRLLENVKKSQVKMRHRGPDWEGMYNSKNEDNVYMAHHRLSIVDPKGGSQPIIWNLEDNDKGNHIKISGYARKGVGRDCICWGVVSECTFFNTIDKAFAKSVIDEQIKDKTKEEQKSMIQDFNSLEQYRYYDKNKFGDPNSFQFSLESETGLSAKYILYKSIVILTNMFQKLLVELREKNDSEVITIVPADVPNMYVITFKNYTHTVGNLIQSHMLNNHIREKPDNDTYDLDYVGYSVPHPLEELFILKVKFNKVVSVKQLYSFMKENLERIETELLQLTEEWVSFSQVDV